MRLDVIGAGPAYTDKRGAVGASYLVSAGGSTILLDLGHGAFANLASAIEPSTLEAILISHLHPDHFVDLVALRHYLRYEFTPPRRLAVFGPAGLADRLDAVNGEPGFSAVSLDVAPFEAMPPAIGPFRIETTPVTHAPGSRAIRLSLGSAAGVDDAPNPATTDGPGLVYTGDCGRADDLLPLLRPGDTLLSECSFGAGPVAPGAQHLASGDAARVANAAGASRLLLTHLQMGFDRGTALAAARAVFDGPVALVTEGDSFEL